MIYVAQHGFFAAAFFTAAFFIGGFIHWLFPGLASFQVAMDLLCLDAVHFFPQALGASEHYVPHGPFYFTKRSHQMCENLPGSFPPDAHQKRAAWRPCRSRQLGFNQVRSHYGCRFQPIVAARVEVHDFMGLAQCIHASMLVRALELARCFETQIFRASFTQYCCLAASAAAWRPRLAFLYAGVQGSLPPHGT